MVELPEGWIIAKSKTYDGERYYFNTFSGQSSWELPSFNSKANGINGSESHLKRDLNDSYQPSAKRSHIAGKEPRVAIVVPFRNEHAEQRRAEHLSIFVPEMTEFMLQMNILFHVYIIEQSNDGRKFNRGKLLNIGYDIAKQEGYNVVILHDVDLIPSAELGPWYSMYPQKPIHIARRWPRYSNNPKYCGGIVSISTKDYEAINGYPNTFWGWGGEDDEMMKRFRAVGLEFCHPDKGTIRDLENMTLSEKLDFLRENKDWKCNVKREALDEHAKTWNYNGIRNLKYTELSRRKLNTHASCITVDVLLNGHWTDTVLSINKPDSSFK